MRKGFGVIQSRAFLAFNMTHFELFTSHRPSDFLFKNVNPFILNDIRYKLHKVLEKSHQSDTSYIKFSKESHQSNS